jgi:riboflavin synthase
VFSGITRGLFEVTAVEREPGLLRYRVDLGELAHGLEVGASVAVAGVCQTVVRVDGEAAEFEAVAQTLAVTTLGALVPGQRVSIERALRVGDEIGGHEVSGHVHGVGRVRRVVVQGGQHELTIEGPVRWSKYLMERGFVALDGSSLTVAEVAHDDQHSRFSVHLVPETVRVTLLGTLEVGDPLNVELDARTVAIVETVERVLAASRG